MSGPVPRPLRVAIVNLFFHRDLLDPLALLERYHSLGAWARAVAAAGPAVTIFQRFHRPESFTADALNHRFVVDGPPGAAGQRFLGRRLAEAVAATAPDLVHVHGLNTPWHVRWLRRRLYRRAAILVQDHGGIHADSPGFRRPAWRLWHRLGLAAADGFLFSAAELAQPWRRARIITRQPVYEVMEASTELAKVESRPGDRMARGRPSLLWVGRLDANKDPLTVLSGFEAAVPRLPEAELTMVFSEDGLLSQVQRRVAASPGLAGRVHMLGRLDRAALPALYASADLFVLGSHHEGSGYALLEALAFGVTPIVTDIPTFRVLTDGGKVGALFGVGDVAALARAIERLGSTAFTARRELVRSHFARALSWPVLGRRAASIYHTAVANRRGSCDGR